MMAWKRIHTLLAGLALIVLTNAVTLFGVAGNRNNIDSRVQLGAREVRLDRDYSFQGEDRSVTLEMKWRAPGATYSYESPDWLDEAKLRELGFDLPSLDREMKHIGWRPMQAKEVFIVLELNGPAYFEGLEQARAKVEREKAALEAAPEDAREQQSRNLEDALDRLKSEENELTRLLAVDAGLDDEALRAKYPNNKTYIMVRGTVQPAYLSYTDGGSYPQQWRGYLRITTVTNIYVPLQFRRVFQELLTSCPNALFWLPDPMVVEPGSELRRLMDTDTNSFDDIVRLQATVAFGKHHEPWLESLSIVPWIPPCSEPDCVAQAREQVREQARARCRR
ncbi:MAG: DUF4824 family protein [Methylobacillus sp.]|jgi:hypothetical protein|nr:DUF4824 family protein [Methylobacillus sp.]